MRLGKGTIREIQYSPDGTRLAIASGIGIWLYDTATGQEVALLTGHMGGVGNVSFSPDGRTLASVSGREIRLWNAVTGVPTHTQTLTGHTDTVYSLAFSPDGNDLLPVGVGVRSGCGMRSRASPRTRRHSPGHPWQCLWRSVQSRWQDTGKWGVTVTLMPSNCGTLEPARLKATPSQRIRISQVV